MASTQSVASSSGKVGGGGGGGGGRKRNGSTRDAASLVANWRERRHHSDTSLGYKMNQRDPIQRKEIVDLSSRAAIASNVSWEVSPVVPRYIDEIVDESEDNVLLPRQASERRQAISYMYLHILMRPAEVDWVEMHVVKSIMLALRIPDGSFGAVKDCLNNIEKQMKQNPNKSFDSASKFHERERHYMIEDGSGEAHIVYEGAASDLSSYNIAVLVNFYRSCQDPPLKMLSKDTITRFEKRSDIVRRFKRQTVKSGSTDKGSLWAHSRLELSTQMKEQIRRGKIVESKIQEGTYDYTKIEGSVHRHGEVMRPILLGAYASSDEHHRQCELGNLSARKTTVSQNAAGQYASAQDGGIV